MSSEVCRLSGIWRSLFSRRDATPDAAAPGGRGAVTDVGELGLGGDVAAPATGGFARPRIVHACDSLRSGRLDEAVGELTGVIDVVATLHPPGFADLLAVAHYLRGRALEEQGRLREAGDDYAAAVSASPAHRAAREAQRHLTSLGAP